MRLRGRPLHPLLLLLGVASVHCGDDAETDGSTAASTTGSGPATTSSAASVGTTTSTGAGGGGDGGSGGSGGAGGGEGGAVPAACTVEALATPEVETVYYVAIGEPGADNEACDGLAPTDEGGGRCPFRDLDSARTRAILIGSDTRVELRAGTYVIQGWEGLDVQGTGDADAPFVLSSYQGEAAILDVASPDGATCMGKDAPERPECVRQTVRVTGRNVIVQGLTIQNGLGYNLEVNGGEDQLIRCNTMTYTADFSLRSDSLKIDGGATRVVIADNFFTQWRSQAIDVTGSSEVTIEDNEFTDPFDADGGAVGMKLGVRSVLLRGNYIHDLGGDPSSHAISMGGIGTATPDPESHLAYEIRVEENRMEGSAGILAQLVSCLDCAVVGNEVTDIGAGVVLSASGAGDPGCSGAPGGCGPSSGAIIEGNVMRSLHGNGSPEVANVFVVVEDEAEAAGLSAGDNVWCAPSVDDARFGWEGELLGFEEWVESSGTDSTSVVAPDGDPRCALPWAD